MAWDRGVFGKCRFCRMEAKEKRAAKVSLKADDDARAAGVRDGAGVDSGGVGGAESLPTRGAAIDYKDVRTLQRLSTPQGKLFSRKRSGTCATHQRQIKWAVKRARFMALLPYVGGQGRGR